MANANAPLPLAQLRMNVPITSPVGSLALVSTASIAVIGFNQQRRGIIFINSSTATMTVVPSNQTAVSGRGVVILPQAQVSFIGDANTNLNYNCGWNAIADGGSNNPLEILELL